MTRAKGVASGTPGTPADQMLARTAGLLSAISLALSLFVPAHLLIKA